MSKGHAALAAALMAPWLALAAFPATAAPTAPQAAPAQTWICRVVYQKTMGMVSRQKAFDTLQSGMRWVGVTSGEAGRAGRLALMTCWSDGRLVRFGGGEPR